VIPLRAALQFALLIVRPGALIMFSPVFGGLYAPAQIKIGLTVFIALALLPTTAVPPIADALPLAVIVAREVAIGFALALAIHALIAGAELAGHLVGFQMGLSYGATVDPQSGVRNPLLTVLYGNLAVVTFLLVGGHHEFLRALHQSFVELPVGAGRVDASLPQTVAATLAVVFQVGLRLAMPVVVVLVLVEVAMALVARSAPALNLMAVGAPVRLMVGLLILPLVVSVVASMVSGTSGEIAQLAMRAARVFR
jgi:flagellar biosynthetic protein FliR